jgi:hypothetical protein
VPPTVTKAPEQLGPPLTASLAAPAESNETAVRFQQKQPTPIQAKAPRKRRDPVQSLIKTMMGEDGAVPQDLGDDHEARVALANQNEVHKIGLDGEHGPTAPRVCVRA